ncbi:PhzF family phenazine biosynthesis protein [Leptospira harrisiae]|uniref:PhzF family phenazine biosynthesis protein n=1 Tax=Leptospira harrisiae TaxID=2023189 RepID=A0A2N0AIB6_9LEPT|nr:PhzF family phenazine biosynthesis protein [Leptospira harrisiae]PJZ84029.1 hypothetical protein CH364_11775 [Leptospira harrisiae]PKA08054.1 hypothetical protein CH366_17185 [Leptospira harrisiae]
MSSVWWVNTFVGQEAGGNPTCVILDDFDEVTRSRASVARALRAPDTAFIKRASAGLTIKFFSPLEGEMSFCGQGFIAADAVLRQATKVAGPIEFLTTDGNVRTFAEPGDGALSWFEILKSQIRIDSGPRHLGHIVDSGRRRAFLQVDSAELENLNLDSSEVIRTCTEYNIKGLCFYAYERRDVLRLRVFTVSLGGREDISTGGAVAGLAPLIPSGKWLVQQGSGHFLNRGELRLNNNIETDSISVGGCVEFVAQGNLL